VRERPTTNLERRRGDVKHRMGRRHSTVADSATICNQLAPLAELKDAPELVERLERRRRELEG